MICMAKTPSNPRAIIGRWHGQGLHECGRNTRVQKPMPVHQSKMALLRLGFVPLTDAAPLILAQELGLFRKHGLRVTLHRELGWATIRDKIVFGELDAAHALAPTPAAATPGL